MKLWASEQAHRHEQFQVPSTFFRPESSAEAAERSASSPQIFWHFLFVSIPKPLDILTTTEIWERKWKKKKKKKDQLNDKGYIGSQGLTFQGK